MDQEQSSIEKVVSLFKRLPGIGEKSAQRFVYFYLNAPKEEGLRLADAIKRMLLETKTCSICYNKTDLDPCKICTDDSRDKFQICVVETPLDVQLIEDTKLHRGKYFVLGGVIDPTNGVGPDELLIDELTDLLKKLSVDKKQIEIIFAFAPSLQSEVTINYVIKKISSSGVVNIKFSKLAQGLQTGSDLQYTDTSTLGRALVGRVEVGK
ncbi:MAG TPA: recombination mediator RecR [Candidatus Dojkabacteria bacterium]|nr:recombination mediator RecR [Candidatus Dojkabacteria bacterium]HQF36117.1 recombination mediator RecR [Candidatus Dojkabacteria bacterium]